MRIVSVYGTDSSKRITNVQLPDEVKTFGDFSRFIANYPNGFSLGNSKVTWLAQGDVLNGSSPDDANAAIPTVERFMVALTPHTANKGAVGYTEMRDAIKARKERAKQERDEYTNNAIGNYTNKNLKELTDLYNMFCVVPVVTVSPALVTTTATTNELFNLETRVGRLEVKLQELEEKLATTNRKIKALEEEVDINNDDIEEDEEEEEEEDEDNDLPDEVREFYAKRNISFND